MFVRGFGKRKKEKKLPSGKKGGQLADE